jgi:hypothetical protein
MSDESFRKTYYANEFTALTNGSLAENKSIIEAALQQFSPALGLPVNEVRLALGGAALIVEWAALPSADDVERVDALIPTIEGVATTSEPFEFNAFEASTSTSSTPVPKIAQVTPPLSAGTYQVIWTSSIRMQAVAANTGIEAKIRLERSDGAVVEQTDAWDLANNHAFNGCITFQILAGQTISAALSFSRLGASGTAEMSGARVTIDQLSPAPA